MVSGELKKSRTKFNGKWWIINKWELYKANGSDCYLIIGAVTISPSPKVTVCYVGDRLEVTCNSTDSILKWRVTFLIENGLTAQLLPVPLISSTALNDMIRVVNTSTLTFSRVSERGLDIPLVSRLVIDIVGSSLNGTIITCMEGNTATMATTTLYIVGGINGEICMPVHRLATLLPSFLVWNYDEHDKYYNFI